MRAGRFLILALVGLLASCATQTPKPPSETLRLSRIGFDNLPGWHDARPDAALSSFKRSCAVLAARPDTEPMSGAGYAGTAGDWREVCARVNGDAKLFFEQNFTPFAVSGSAPENIGLFTGYFEPEIRGSRTRHDGYQTPVYGLPPDLVRADLGRFIPKLKGEHISGKVDGNALVPYASRAQINADGLSNTKVLFYTDDAVAF
ncbi:MAG TPA: MltA domain-containing protein, partial [Rhizomicrobium sp.]|nr:MltA domain-containing protein [Rhizomicrobium sp.]